jgi:thiol-disulfide isomerase/thioredoxin
MTSPQEHDNSRLPWLLGLGALLVWVVYLLMAVPRMDSTRLPEPTFSDSVPDEPAQYVWRLEDLDGKPVDFSSFRGKTIFLNIWATWCPPCVAELPSIDRLAKDPRLKDVAFACVSSDESLAGLRRFVRERRLTVPVLRMLEDPPEVFQTDAVPASFVVRSDGRIIMKEIGAAEWDGSLVVQLLAGLAERSEARKRQSSRILREINAAPAR